MRPDQAVAINRAEAKRVQAWQNVLATDSGKLVMADILARCHHWRVVTDPEHRVLQQFAIELLRASGLYVQNSGSFPAEYVYLLMRTKLERQPAPTVKQSWFGRLLGRKNNV